MSNVKIGEKVCMNRRPDAAVFKVVEINGFSIALIDAAMDPAINQRRQWVDREMINKATAKQLKNLVTHGS